MMPILNASARHIATASVGGSRVFDVHGNLNATNKADAMQRIVALFAEMASGNVASDEQELATQQTPAEKREILTAAYRDTTGNTWAELGAMISGRLTETGSRSALARQFLLRGDLVQGSRPRFEVDVKDSVAVKVVGPVQTHTSIVRDRYIEVDEVQYVARPFVAENDLNQGSGDLLDKAYLNAMEQIQRQEDLGFRAALIAATQVSSANIPTYFAGQFNKTYLTDMQDQVNSWFLTAAGLLMSTDILSDISNQSGFTDFFDPISKYEIIQTGRIGQILGMSITTDAYRHSRMKVLNRGEVFALASPEQLGGYTDRGPVQSVPIGPGEEKIIGKGWMMYESFAQVITNARGVALAKKT